MAEQRLCEVCHEPLPPGSFKHRMYCDKCKDVVFNNKRREIRQKEILKRTAFIRNVTNPELTIQVLDPQCFIPYWISQMDYELYKDEFEQMPDVKLVFPGEGS
jgi:predicted nucleic acid-binding Zn ribbon protein